MSEEKCVYTACPGWGDHEQCVIKTIVSNGKIRRTEKIKYTGPESDEGFICLKGIIGGNLPYLPNRLQTPLKRIGLRGEGKWQKISWEQAIDEIGTKLCELRDKYGPESLAVWLLTAGDPPSFGLNALLTQRFMSLYGATDPLQSISVDNGPYYASFFDFGTNLGYLIYDPNLIDKAKYIIAWGLNPLENQQRVGKHVIEAVDKGAKLVDIGVLFDATAARADWFIPVKPGSDAALALSMANIIVNNGLYDEKFLTEHTVAPFLVRLNDGMFLKEGAKYIVWDNQSNKPTQIDPKSSNINVQQPALRGTYIVNGERCQPAFQLLIDHLKFYTPESQEVITGVPAKDVYKLTYEYTAVKPALLLCALGIRYQNAGDTHRAINLLATLTGNIGMDGGGVTVGLAPNQYPIAFNDIPIAFPEGVENSKVKYLRLVDFFDQVKTQKPYPIKAFLKAMGNPFHNISNEKRWVEEVLPNLELVVDYDIWMTDTGLYSDYVLPGCTSFERTEIISGASFNHIILQEPAIDPIAESKPPVFLWSQLAKKVGLEKYFDKTEEDWLTIRLQSSQPFVADISPKLTLDRLKKEKIIRANVPEVPLNLFKNLSFNTPSGRIEFYSDLLVNFNEQLAKYRTPMEVANPLKTKKYPYQIMTSRHRFFMQSQYTNHPVMVKLSGDKPKIGINPADATELGLINGDLVECFNDRGNVQAEVEITNVVPSGTIQALFAWSKDAFSKGTFVDLPIMASKETTDELANYWYKLVLQKEGGFTPFFLGGESFVAGAWDTLWDSVCEVRKIEGGK